MGACRYIYSSLIRIRGGGKVRLSFYGVIKKTWSAKKLMALEVWKWPWTPGRIGYPPILIPWRSKEDWLAGSEGNCYDEKEPIYDERYWGTGSDLPTMQMVDKVLSRLGSKVSVINITQLSEYRKDGHPTIYVSFGSHQARRGWQIPRHIQIVYTGACRGCQMFGMSYYSNISETECFLL